MTLLGQSEFVGAETKTSKNGNSYKILRFDDLLTGEQISFYWNNSNKSVIPVLDLQRRHIYALEFDYHYNGYDKRYQLDLVNISGEVVNE